MSTQRLNDAVRPDAALDIPCQRAHTAIRWSAFRRKIAHKNSVQQPVDFRLQSTVDRRLLQVFGAVELRKFAKVRP
jgi:hypothetical protein